MQRIIIVLLALTIETSSFIHPTTTSQKFLKRNNNFLKQSSKKTTAVDNKRKVNEELELKGEKPYVGNDGQTEKEFSPRKFTASVQKMKQAGLNTKADVTQLFKLWEENKVHFNVIHYAAVFTTVASADPHLLESSNNAVSLRLLVEDIVCKLSQSPEFFHARELAMIIYSVGRMQINNRIFFNSIASPPYRDKLTKEGDAHSISNIAWACSRVGYFSEELFECIDESAAKIVNQYAINEGTTQSISLTLKAFASLGYQGEKLFNVVEKHANEISANCTDLHLSNIAWSFQKFGKDFPFKDYENKQQLLNFNVMRISPEKMSNHISYLKRTNNVEGVLNLFKYYGANMNHIHYSNIFGCLVKNYNTDEGRTVDLVSDERFLALLDSTFERWNAYKYTDKVPWFDARSMATIIYSLGKMRIKEMRFFDHVSNNRTSQMLLEAQDSQAIANIVWACAKVNYYNSTLLCNIASHGAEISVQGGSQALSNIIHGFVKLSHIDHRLLDSVADQFPRLVTTGDDPFGLASLFTSFSISGSTRGAEILTAVAEKGSPDLIEKLKSSSEQLVANIIWSSSVYGVCAGKKSTMSTKLISEIWNRIVDDDLNRYSFAIDGYRQLNHFFVAATIEKGDRMLKRPGVKLSRKLSEAAFLEASKKNSKQKMHVSNMLVDRCGIANVENNVQADGVGIDIAILDLKVAVEVQTKFQFHKVFCDESGRYELRDKGQIVAKKRLLRALGWKVLCVDYAKFVTIANNGRGSEAQVEFLKDELIRTTRERRRRRK